MKKYIVLTLFLTIFGSSAMAIQPISDFEVESGFDNQFVGGEGHHIKANFSNVRGIELPAYVRLNVTSEDNLTGEEFDVEAVVRSENSEEERTSDLQCSPLNDVQYDNVIDGKTMIYSCFGDGDELLPDSENSLDLNATSSVRIVPGSYNFSLRLYSRIGKPNSTGNVMAESGTINSDRAKVEFNATEDVYITYSDYSDIYSSTPEGEFIEAIEVVSSPGSQQATSCLPYIPDLSDSFFDYVNSDGYFFDRLKCSKKETDISGTVEFDYSDYNPSTTDIYKLEEEGWTKLDDTYRNDGTIKANVSGFSVYAAFGEPVGTASEEGVLSFDNVMPGDKGVSIIEVNVSETSRMYVGANKTLDEDYTCNDPELEAEPGCSPGADGELDEAMNISAWIDDDGDGVYEGQRIMENVTEEKLVLDQNGNQRNFTEGTYNVAFNWSLALSLGNEAQTDKLEYLTYARTEEVETSEDSSQEEEQSTAGSSGGSITVSSIEQNADDSGSGGFEQISDDSNGSEEEEEDEDRESGGTSSSEGASPDDTTQPDSASQDEEANQDEIEDEEETQENNLSPAFALQQGTLAGLGLFLLLLVAAAVYFRQEIVGSVKTVF